MSWEKLAIRETTLSNLVITANPWNQTHDSAVESNCSSNWASQTAMDQIIKLYFTSSWTTVKTTAPLHWRQHFGLLPSDYSIGQQFKSLPIPRAILSTSDLAHIKYVYTTWIQHWQCCEPIVQFQRSLNLCSVLCLGISSFAHIILSAVLLLFGIFQMPTWSLVRGHPMSQHFA